MLRRVFHSLALGAALAVSGGVVCAAPVDSSEIVDRTERTPKRMDGVDVEEKLGATLSTALAFKDELGRDRLLGEVLSSGLPTIVTLNYSDCPMLCSMQLNGLVASMKQIDLELGRDYRIVTVSLDPKDTTERVARMKSRYLSMYSRPESDAGWTFLTGSEQNIQAVAAQLGVTYNYNEKRDEYVHPAAFAVLTPSGVVARYLYGLEYHPKTLRLSLIEASEGKVGSSLDRLILYCFHYDASEGRYAPVAMNIMRLSGGAGALALGGMLTGLWRAERKRKPLSKTSS